MLLALLAGCAAGPGTGDLARLASEAPVELPARYTCFHACGPIVVDGWLDEPCWGMAPSTGRFRLTADGAADAPPTRAKMLWYEGVLYVAFECADEDVYATFLRRDEALYSQDVVEVFISEQTLGKGHFLEYEFSPLGTLFDSYVVRPFQGRTDWDSSGLAARAIVYGTQNRPGDRDGGYVVEIAIPLAGLFTDSHVPLVKEGTVVRMNLYRIDYSTPAKLGEPGADPRFCAWSPTGAVNFHMPERFGEVVFTERPVSAARQAAAPAAPAGRP